jgi:ankyrin repeat protein
MGLHKPFLLAFVILQLAFTPQASKQELNDQMFEAVRKGDAAAVTVLLDKGADVNARFRYGMTALFKAAERGNPAVVKVLLDRGVDVNVKDTFYGATAMTWALDNGHVEAVRLLLEKVPTEVDSVLTTGAREGNLELVKVALDRGGSKAESLTLALVAASDDQKKAAIVELLKKAGAMPPPAVDAATLQSYVGKYKGDAGPEISFFIKDGKFFGTTAGAGQFALMPLNNTTFRPTAFAGLKFTFNVESGKVVGLSFVQGPNTIQLKRVEETKQP